MHLSLDPIKNFFGLNDEEPDPDQLLAAAQIEDLKWLMSDKRGRCFVWRLLGKAGVYRTSYTGNDGTIFNEGQRNIGLWLLAEITEHCLTEYTAMLKENN